jgi:D-cysteine desulfhydrase
MVAAGKALFQWLQDVQSHPDDYQNSRVLFIHTGGMLGMYDKIGQLQAPVEALERVHRLRVT